MAIKSDLLESKWTIPLTCLVVAAFLIFLIMNTARVPERPHEPQIVPITPAKFNPGTVIYTDTLPKPTQPGAGQPPAGPVQSRRF